MMHTRNINNLENSFITCVDAAMPLTQNVCFFPFGGAGGAGGRATKVAWDVIGDITCVYKLSLVRLNL